MGVIFWRPQPWGAIASMVLGIATGAILNVTPGVSWQAATFIEILVCILVFLGSGIVLSKDAAYLKRVQAFFKKLATPAPAAAAADSNFTGGLMLIYAVAFLVTGGLFTVMAIPSIGSLSGKLAAGSGLVCLTGALIFYLKRTKPVKTVIPVKPELMKTNV